MGSFSSEVIGNMDAWAAEGGIGNNAGGCGGSEEADIGNNDD